MPAPPDAPSTRRSPARQVVRWLVIVAVGLGGALTIDLIRQALAVDRVAWRDVELPVDDLMNAEVQAAEADMPRLLRFSADWCGPCRMMETDVFSRPDVADAIHARVVPIRIDLSAPGEIEQAWTHHYAVVALPTLLLVDADGQELTRLTGGVGAEAFLAWLDRDEGAQPLH